MRKLGHPGCQGMYSSHHFQVSYDMPLERRLELVALIHKWGQAVDITTWYYRGKAPGSTTMPPLWNSAKEKTSAHSTMIYRSGKRGNGWIAMGSRSKQKMPGAARRWALVGKNLHEYIRRTRSLVKTAHCIGFELYCDLPKLLSYRRRRLATYDNLCIFRLHWLFTSNWQSTAIFIFS